MTGRILVTTDAVGGVWRYSLTLAREWAAAGIAVELATLGPRPDLSQQREAASIPGLILHMTDSLLDWTAPDAAALVEAGSELAELADGLGVDGVHLHAPALLGDAATIWPVPVVAVLHSCLLTWWRALRQGPPPPDFAWRIAATAAGLRRADHVVTPSRTFRDQVLAAYGPVARITAIPNGRRPPQSPTRPASDRPRAVLAAGRFWDEAKDAATLDRAATLLDAPMLAAGSLRGPDGTVVRLASARALGPLDEPALAAAFADARVFVSTARYEPFGLAVLEAAQAGLALVLSDIPSFRELWDGVARFVPTGDAAGFADALAEVLDAPAALAGAASRRAASYTAAAMAEATLALHRPAATLARFV